MASHSTPIAFSFPHPAPLPVSSGDVTLTRTEPLKRASIGQEARYSVTLSGETKLANCRVRAILIKAGELWRRNEIQQWNEQERVLDFYLCAEGEKSQSYKQFPFSQEIDITQLFNKYRRTLPQQGETIPLQEAVLCRFYNNVDAYALCIGQTYFPSSENKAQALPLSSDVSITQNQAEEVERPASKFSFQCENFVEKRELIDGDTYYSVEAAVKASVIDPAFISSIVLNNRQGQEAIYDIYLWGANGTPCDQEKEYRLRVDVTGLLKESHFKARECLFRFYAPNQTESVGEVAIAYDQFFGEKTVVAKLDLSPGKNTEEHISSEKEKHAQEMRAPAIHIENKSSDSSSSSAMQVQALPTPIEQPSISQPTTPQASLSKGFTVLPARRSKYATTPASKK